MAYKAPCCGGSGHYSGLPQIPLTITPVCVGTHKHCFTLMACVQSGVWFCQTHIKVERVMSSLEECCVVARPRDHYLRQTCPAAGVVMLISPQAATVCEAEGKQLIM